MKVKETIAFIGEADQACCSIVQKLAAAAYPLVLVNNNGSMKHVRRQLLNEVPGADVEIAGCAREGCWEADIIMLCENGVSDAGLAEKIREVAAQKIVVSLVEKRKQNSAATQAMNSLKAVLCNSQWVQLVMDPFSGEMRLTGEAAATTIIENMLSAVHTGKPTTSSSVKEKIIIHS